MNIRNIIIFITLILSISNIAESKKKGTTFGSDTSSDEAKCNDIRDLNVSWYYNWGVSKTCQNTAIIPNVDFYPTIRVQSDLNSNTANIIEKADILFTFNEPNFKNQANMLPAQASALWPDIEKLGFKTIVGPSMADCGDDATPDGEYCTYGTIKWYKEFLGNCSNCQIDFVNIHIYYCDANDVMNKITNLNKATGKKVWLTEFNCNGANTYAQVLEYAQKLLPMLEESDIVEGYSWFLPFYTESGGNVNSLYSNQNGNGDLTPIGKYYAGTQSSLATKSNISIVLLALVLLFSILF